MRMMREHVLEKLDELLENYQPYTADNLEWLGYRLDHLFDGDEGPYVKDVRSVSYEDGKLVVRLLPSVDDVGDYDEWCAAFREYIEDRFEVIPQYPRTISISIDDIRDSSFSFGYIVADREPSPGAGPIWLDDIYPSKPFGKDARVIHPPKAKPSVKPPPPHLSLYQQRGSKGKRKRW